MTQPATQIHVTSHVGRDLLQSAEVFKTEKHVVWEYVSNGLQYVAPGTTPEVRVEVTTGAKPRIVISDNGRGMGLKGLQNFFVMHGENQDRKTGRGGRGRFGTGKSAAFGIADRLTITTVHEGRRTKVELKRSDIKAMSGGDPIPVRILENEVATDEASGTTVEIGDLQLRKVDLKSVVNFIERHILRWPNANVWVNHHHCELAMPAVQSEHRFSSAGTVFAETIGEVELLVKVAKAPLPDELQGIAVMSGGVWHESTLAGLDRKEFANYLFGEVDVPALDSDTSVPSPFDLSRSMQLNAANETVKAIHAFVGSCLSAILRDLAQAERKRREGEEAKKLQQEASRIAQIINRDFSEYQGKFRKAATRVGGGGDLHTGAVPGEGDEQITVRGHEQPGAPTAEAGPGPAGESDGGSKKPNDYPRAPGIEESEGDDPTAAKAPAKLSERAPRGGFNVEFCDLGTEAGRARYDSESRTIFVNLEHPQVAAAKGLRGIEDPAFRRLAYEVAFAEYALGLAYMLDEEGQFIETFEPIREIRDTIDRVTRAGAALYRE